jgi:hypothetical protein
MFGLFAGCADLRFCYVNAPWLDAWTKKRKETYSPPFFNDNTASMATNPNPTITTTASIANGNKEPNTPTNETTQIITSESKNTTAKIPIGLMFMLLYQLQKRKGERVLEIRLHNLCGKSFVKRFAFVIMQCRNILASLAA